LPSSSVARKLIPVVFPPGERAHQSAKNKIVGPGEDRDRPGCFLHHTGDRGATGQDRVDPSRDERRRDLRGLLCTHGEAPDHLQIIAFDKPRPTQFVEHRHIVRVLAWVHGHYTEPIDAPVVLRAADRGVEERGTEQDDQIAAVHSMTSSARARIEGGTVSPSAFAVLRLMTSSKVVGCCTGRSAGLAPLRILPV
jgi:hypothetical protein